MKFQGEKENYLEDFQGEMLPAGEKLAVKCYGKSVNFLEKCWKKNEKWLF